MARKVRQKNNSRKSGNHDVLAIVLIVVSAFLLLCIVIPPILSVVSQTVFSVLLGTFGIVIYPVLVATLLGGVFLFNRRTPYVSVKTGVCSALLAFFALVILQLATSHAFLKQPFGEYISSVYNAKYTVGGVIMGTIAFGLKTAITEIGCYVVFSVGILAVVAVMINIVALIRNRRAPVKEPEKKPRSGFLSDAESKRVTALETPSKLYVGQIAPRLPADYGIDALSGTASDLPVNEPRRTSDYGAMPIYSSPVTPPSSGMDKNVARDTLYGGSDTLNMRMLDDFNNQGMQSRKTQDVQSERNTEYMRDVQSAQSVYESYAEPSQPTYAEPHVKVDEDARANRPKRVDHDEPQLEVQFPSQRNYYYSDEGIETAELDIKKHLSEDTEKRKQSEIESAARDERYIAPATPSFSSRVDNSRVVRPDGIFNAPKDGGKAQKPAPSEKISPLESPVSEFSVADSIIVSPGKSDDELIKSFEELRGVGNAAPLPDENEIIDASELNGRYVEEQETEPEPVGEIIDAAAPYAEPNTDREEIFDGTDSMTEAGGLVIADGPAVDMSETHDITSDLIDGEDRSGAYVAADAETAEPAPAQKSKAKKLAPIDNQISMDMVIREKAQSIVVDDTRRRKRYDNYTPPPIDLLKPSVREDVPAELLQETATTLEAVMSGFLKADIKVIRIVPGPTVTRYELEVPSGVSVKSIATRCSDIEYELAAVGHVRVEAPIPGKRAVGIEVPNAQKGIVALREVVESSEYKNSKSSMTSALGVDIGGAVVCCNLEKIPHLLIGGQTGSGKSACLNGLIISLLYSASPDDVRFILIDPKRVEFAKYNHMPHLLFDSIITEPNDAFSALKWASNEMERRYMMMAKYGCSNLGMYNELPDVKTGKSDKMPHIIIIVDELADLMLSTAKHEIEERIKVISAKARAAGIHLILATQSPRSDVLTGTIKANMTAFIAFKVSNQLESRIILDTMGAEALVGQGDMLYFPSGYFEPRRLQGSFITDEEVISVITYIKENCESDFDEDAASKIYNSNPNSGMGGLDSAKEDPMFQDILAFCIKNKQASSSGIQRRFSIGYARASRIVEYMAEVNYIGPSTNNSKPREVYITAEKFKELFGREIDE